MRTQPKRLVLRDLPKSKRLVCTGARQPSRKEVVEAIEVARTSGVVDVLELRLRRRRDANARLSLLGYEVAKSLRGWEKNHRMHLIDIVKILNALHPSALVLLGMPAWRHDGGYDHFQRLHSRVAAALLAGWRHIDPATGETLWIDRLWYLETVSRGPVPRHLVDGCALAIDGTGMDTWARLHGPKPVFDSNNDEGDAT